RAEAPPDEFGKLREPVLAVTNLLRGIGWTVPNPDMDPDPGSDFALTNPGGTPTASLAQGEGVFPAPTGFHFLPPEFPVPGSADLVGPEFGILSTASALTRDDLLYRLIEGNYAFMHQATYRPNFVQVDLTSLMPFAEDPQALVEQLNQTLLRGEMPDAMK